MTFRRFEDIDAWRTARDLNIRISRLANQGKFDRDFALKNQILRALASIMANIAEGLSCKSDKEFARFLITAKRSALEAQSHFYVALDRKYFSDQEFQTAYLQAQRCAKQLSGLISYLLKPLSL